MSLAEVIGDAVESALHAASGLETKLDEEVIAEVRKRLNECVTEFSGNEFNHAKIAHASFGASPEGVELATHHGLAQSVIQDTLLGIVDDLTVFSKNVRKAADLVKDADGSSTADLKAKMALVTQLDAAAHHMHGDDAYNQARNHHHYHPTHFHPKGGK